MTHAHNEKTERNSVLVAAYQLGATTTALAAQYGITRARVCDILQRAGVQRRTTVVMSPATRALITKQRKAWWRAQRRAARAVAEWPPLPEPAAQE